MFDCPYLYYVAAYTHSILYVRLQRAAEHVYFLLQLFKVEFKLTYFFFWKTYIFMEYYMLYINLFYYFF